MPEYLTSLIRSGAFATIEFEGELSGELAGVFVGVGVSATDGDPVVLLDVEGDQEAVALASIVDIRPGGSR